MRLWLRHIKRLKPSRNLAEKRCTPIVLRKCLPMVACPQGAFDLGFANSLVILAFHFDRNRQPLHSLRSLDLVAITPVTTGVLHVVIQDKLIHRGDHVEITLPGDVIRLQDSDFFHLLSCFFTYSW